MESLRKQYFYSKSVAIISTHALLQHHKIYTLKKKKGEKPMELSCYYSLTLYSSFTLLSLPSSPDQIELSSLQNNSLYCLVESLLTISCQWNTPDL